MNYESFEWDAFANALRILSAYGDVTTLFEILLWAGLTVGVVVTGLGYPDCTRRGLSTSSRVVWTLACGSGVSPFFVPYAYR